MSTNKHNYTIIQKVNGYYITEIEATNEDEAIAKAELKTNEEDFGKLQDIEFSHINIEECK